MGCLPVLARRYTDVVARFGVLREAFGAGHVMLVATTAPVGIEALASLSELGFAAIATSARGDRGWSPPTKLRIGLFVARSVWSGPIRVMAHARSCGSSWLLDCEVRDEQGRLLSTAFAAVPE